MVTWHTLDQHLVTKYVLSCNLDTEEWFTFPECPREWFTLAVVHSLLTAVGGMKPGDYTNTLLSLVEKGRKTTWVQHFPAMPTKHALTAVICSGKALVVAGGWGEGGHSTEHSRSDEHRHSEMISSHQPTSPSL